MQYCVQALEQGGARAADIAVLKALWNIFKAFSQPREELSSPASPSDAQSPHSSNGEHTNNAPVLLHLKILFLM